MIWDVSVLVSRKNTSRYFVLVVVAVSLLAACGRSKTSTQKVAAKPVPTITAAPQLSPPPGLYDQESLVTLSSADAKAKIYYTLDGSDPIVERSLLYSIPIKVEKNQVVRAVAKSAELEVSDVVGGGYAPVARGALNEAYYAAVEANAGLGSAEQINDGIFGDPNNGWAIDGKDSALNLKFDAPTQVARLMIAGNPGTGGHVSSVRIFFSDGSDLTVDALAENGVPSEVEFEPKTVDWVKLVVQASSGMNAGIAEFAAFGPPSDQKISAAEHFPGMLWGWNLAAKRDVPSGWQIVDKRNESNVFMETTHDGYEVGVYGVWDHELANDGFDLRLRARDDNLNVNALDGTGMLGVIFGYQDDNNFYRYSASVLRGFRLLEKREHGVFTELVRSTQSNDGGRWINFRIVMQAGKIVVLQDGKVALAAEDHAFSGGKIAVWSGHSDSASFDRLTLMTAPPSPIIGLQSPVEYSVTQKLDITAKAIVSTSVAGVEFVVDEGQPGEQRAHIKSAPFQSSFRFAEAGDHIVTAAIVDEAGKPLPGLYATTAAVKVGVGGAYIMAFGDSITERVGDDWALDDFSRDGRVTGGGYGSVLSDMLSAHLKTRPVVILNEGYAGEMTHPAVEKIVAVLKRHPEATVVLFQMGTNDSSGDLALSDVDFYGRVKQMADSVLAAGKEIYIARPMPRLRKDKQNELLRKYNQQIEKLVQAYHSSHPGKVHLGPDFYRHFDARHEEYSADGIHPNGEGFRSMARLWFAVLKDKI